MISSTLSAVIKAKRRVGLCVLLLFALYAISAIAVHKKFGRAYVTRSGKIQFRSHTLLVITNENRIWALFDAEHLSISDVTMLKEVTKEDEMLEQLKKISGYLEPSLHRLLLRASQLNSWIS